MSWYRPESERTWHVGRAVGASFVTLCNGRFALADGDAVEHMDQPPHVDRCDDCQRQNIDRIRIERALADLRRSATYDWPSAHEFDLGGEA